MNPNPDKSKAGKSTENPLPPAPQPATVEPVVAPVSPTQPTSSQGLAIATLVIGIIAFLTGFLGIGVILGILAIVLGAIALIKHQGGKAMTIIGMSLGAIAVVLGGFIFLLLLAANSVLQDSFETQFQEQPMQQNQLQVQI